VLDGRSCLLSLGREDPVPLQVALRNTKVTTERRSDTTERRSDTTKLEV
jgi:hypothetical protein